MNKKLNLFAIIALAVVSGLFLIAASSGPYSESLSNMEDNIMGGGAAGSGNDEMPDWAVMPKEFVLVTFVPIEEEEESGEPTTTKTDSEGGFSVKLPEGIYDVKIDLKPEIPPKDAKLITDVRGIGEYKLPERIEDKRFKFYKLERPAHVISVRHVWDYKVLLLDGGVEIKPFVDERERVREYKPGEKIRPNWSFKLNPEPEFGREHLPLGRLEVNAQTELSGEVFRLY